MTPLTPPRERFFLNFPFFPRRVITSLSARQLRRKKSSNNHIYGAAASLRCIDPRRWPRGGRRAGGKRGKSPSVEAKWKEKRKTEEAREKEGKEERKTESTRQKERRRFVGIEVLARRVDAGIFPDMARAARTPRRSTKQPPSRRRGSRCPCAWTLTVEIEIYISRRARARNHVSDSAEFYRDDVDCESLYQRERGRERAQPNIEKRYYKVPSRSGNKRLFIA